MSDFLYCHDPLDEEAGEYILHLGRPNGLIKIILLDEQDPIEGDEFVHKTYEYENDDISEDYQLVFTPFEGLSDNSNFSSDDILEILDNAWAYWVDVLDWEDEEEDEDE